MSHLPARLDSASLVALRDQLARALDTVDQLLEHAGRRCHECRRTASDLALCADGQWRGPKCRTEWAARTGTQLDLEGDAE